jgi:hypothetical protein
MRVPGLGTNEQDENDVRFFAENPATQQQLTGAM